MKTTDKNLQLCCFNYHHHISLDQAKNAIILTVVNIAKLQYGTIVEQNTLQIQ